MTLEKCLYKKECNDWNYSDTDFIHWKLKLPVLNFLMDSVLITIEHIDKKQKFHQVTPYENDLHVQARLGVIWKNCVRKYPWKISSNAPECYINL